MKGTLSRLQEQLQRLHAAVSRLDTPAADRVRSDLAAAIFHLSRTASDKPIVAMIGGTGTGKSTLVNRLLGVELCATSFRRTFTAGPIAIGREDLPSGFASLTHVDAEESPAKGKPDRIALVKSDAPLTSHLTLIDTPDIDGELVEHHAAADRVFRWADAVVFLVTPEKYQMPELQPYYRLAARYAIGTVFVMNKSDESAVVDDYAKLLSRSGVESPVVRAIARDDSTWQPSPEQKLDSSHLESIRINVPESAHRARIADVLSRINDQLLGPLLDHRHRVDKTIVAIRAIGGSSVEVNVHPLTQQLQRRLREKSVLYLMGPQRVLDRVRSVPSMLVRLPKSMWTWTKTGEFALPNVNDVKREDSPDFRAIVIEQFQSLQSRIDDLIRGQVQIESNEWKLAPDRAGAIVDDELAALKQWLETKWNATPRDTAILNRILKVIPGATGASKYSEAAPYLLTGYLAMSGALFGHLDLIALAGYGSVVTLFQRLSDEVASRTRQTNKTIAERYAKLAREQLDTTTSWLDRQAPSREQLREIESTLHTTRQTIT